MTARQFGNTLEDDADRRHARLLQAAVNRLLYNSGIGQTLSRELDNAVRYDIGMEPRETADATPLQCVVTIKGDDDANNAR